MGRLREGCGAVSGMALVAGMLYGYASPTDGENKARTYGMMQELARRFRERNGSLLCRDQSLMIAEAGCPEAPLRWWSDRQAPECWRE